MCCSSVPPGLGKTTLAQIVARELGVGFRATSGPVIAKAGDLAALLTNLEERDVLFIDEIHRLSPAVEEVLYPAMEDFQLDLIIGEGPAARSVKIELAKFTLVGATTRAGLLTNPLRDRFGIPVRLNFYTEEELEKIVTRGARVLNIGMTPDGANEIARRARGTPRIAGRLLRRVRDFASAADAASIDRNIADHALSALEVDAAGLDAMDRRYLTTIAMNYGGGPVGVETMAAALSEPRDAIEDIIEPYLIQCGYLQRTPRGRLLTSHAFRHLGLAEPARDPAQFGLFGGGRKSRHGTHQMMLYLMPQELAGCHAHHASLSTTNCSAKAQEYAGVTEKSRCVREALKALVERRPRAGLPVSEARNRSSSKYPGVADALNDDFRRHCRSGFKHFSAPRFPPSARSSRPWLSVGMAAASCFAIGEFGARRRVPRIAETLDLTSLRRRHPR